MRSPVELIYTKENSKKNQKPRKGPSILVADDNGLIRDLLSLGLIKNNYRVHCACGGKEALKILDNEQIDLILLDIMMPDLDGLSVLRHIRERHSCTDLPVVMVTAVNESEEIVTALEMGANDYVTKPIDVPVVLARLKTQLSLRDIKRELEDKNKILEKIATLDELTGIPNRRYFNQYFHREYERAARHQSPLSLIFCDVDCFKAYNDQYGHQQGDFCLKEIAGILQDTVRRSVDMVTRFGGEEFVIVLPDTDEHGAYTFAERIRRNVEERHLEHPKSTVTDHVTISLGTATAVPDVGSDPSDLIAIADQELYEAKRDGKNCTKSKKIA